jgi:hypothetical protein
VEEYKIMGILLLEEIGNPDDNEGKEKEKHECREEAHF